MGPNFNPHAYGNPYASRDAATEGLYHVVPHPTREVPRERPVSQESSGASWHSAPTGEAAQDRQEDEVVQEERSEGSLRVQPTDSESRTTTVDVKEPTLDRHLLLASSVQVNDYPAFDMKAYGDPTRKDYNQMASRNRTQNRRRVRLSSGTETMHNTTQESQVAIEAMAEPAQTKAEPQIATPPQHAESVSSISHFTLDESRRSLQHPHHSTPQLKMDSVQTTSSKKVSADKVKTTPKTYETLKRGDETPEEMVARLQQTGMQEVFRRVSRKDQREIPTTTALTLLDILRKSPPPEPKGPQLNVNPDANQAPASIDTAQHSRDQQRQSPVEPVNIASARIAVAVQSVDNHTSSQQSSSVLNENNRGTPIPNANVPPLRASRWAAAADMKAPPIRPNSNAEGSGDSTDSDTDSLRPMLKGLGRLVRTRKPLVAEERLVGWDGEFLPPPAEWEHRPQFYNNTPEYISGFENWLGEVTVRTMSDKSVAELSFGVISPDEVADIENHADGIGFMSRETVLHPKNALRYGHRLIAPVKPGKDDPPLDFEAFAKLDLSDPANIKFKDETAQILIDRNMAQIKRKQEEFKERLRLEKEAEAQAQAEALRDQEAAEAAAELQQMTKANPLTTTKNLYLRPAVEADAPGMTAILNWHIEHGIRPSELVPVTEDDVIERIRMSQHARLPVIVAIERTRKTSGTRHRRQPRVRPDHPIQNIDPDYIGVSRDEPILGWASATDWSANDYVETTTAELELYVAKDHRKSGVGRCLMEAILEGTDRGYMKTGNFEFRCAQGIKHLYTGGGGRDLHKLIFQVRSFSKQFSPEHVDRVKRSSYMSPPPLPPMNRRGRYNYQHVDVSPRPPSPSTKDYSKSARIDDREDDYEIWLKEWLERYDFEEEACLKKLGTKKHRFVDVRYVCRETHWQPEDGQIRDFTKHGF